MLLRGGKDINKIINEDVLPPFACIGSPTTPLYSVSGDRRGLWCVMYTLDFPLRDMYGDCTCPASSYRVSEKQLGIVS